MKVKDIFKSIKISHSFRDDDIFLDHNNCKITNKTKQDDAIILSLRREEDGLEGKAYLRVREEYTEIASQLLKWTFRDPRIIGLTVSELRELEINLRISSVGGRMQVN